MPATSPAANRVAADRCPGVLRLAEAADGYLARIRLPGGLIGAGQMRVLARLAAERGDHAEAARLWAAVLAECPTDREAASMLERSRTWESSP